MMRRLLVLLLVALGIGAATPDPALLMNGAPSPGLPSAEALLGASSDPAWVAPALGRGVGVWLDRSVTVEDFATGSQTFDGEWLFGTYQMAALGYGRLALADPVGRTEWIRRMELCLDRLDAVDTRAFDVHAWGEDPLADGFRGHAAWLGYAGLAHALHDRIVGADAPNRVIEALRRRFVVTPLPETYPGERYPVDMIAGIAALLLRDPDDVLARAWLAETLPMLRDESGLLVQAVDAKGRPRDRPRGSGTFLAAYFLGLADPEAARGLYEDGRSALFDRAFTLGVMREYPPGVDGRGDIDSGPIFLGYGVSATGFAIGAAALAGDAATARELLRTADAFGGPNDFADGDGNVVRSYRRGGPLGDAILFAMTAAAAR